jgi:transcriptional regulator with XRE-family HTH domain
MAIDQDALEAMSWAQAYVPEVLRTFMRVAGVGQTEIGAAIGLTQTQMSRRLNGRSDLSQQELVALAKVFGVEAATFYKPLPEAVADLMASAKLDELRSGSSIGRVLVAA